MTICRWGEKTGMVREWMTGKTVWCLQSGRSVAHEWTSVGYQEELNIDNILNPKYFHSIHIMALFWNSVHNNITSWRFWETKRCTASVRQNITLDWPEQVTPSPLNPGRQVHVKLPTLLVQLAWALQPPLFVVHSLMSALSQIKRSNYY